LSGLKAYYKSIIYSEITTKSKQANILLGRGVTEIFELRLSSDIVCILKNDTC